MVPRSALETGVRLAVIERAADAVGRVLEDRGGGGHDHADRGIDERDDVEGGHQTGDLADEAEVFEGGTRKALITAASKMPKAQAGITAGKSSKITTMSICKSHAISIRGLKLRARPPRNPHHRAATRWARIQAGKVGDIRVIVFLRCGSGRLFILRQLKPKQLVNRDSDVTLCVHSFDTWRPSTTAD